MYHYDVNKEVSFETETSVHWENILRSLKLKTGDAKEDKMNTIAYLFSQQEFASPSAMAIMAVNTSPFWIKTPPNSCYVAEGRTGFFSSRCVNLLDDYTGTPSDPSCSWRSSLYSAYMQHMFNRSISQKQMSLTATTDNVIFFYPNGIHNKTVVSAGRYSYSHQGLNYVKAISPAERHDLASNLHKYIAIIEKLTAQLTDDNAEMLDSQSDDIWKSIKNDELSTPLTIALISKCKSAYSNWLLNMRVFFLDMLSLLKI